MDQEFRDKLLIELATSQRAIQVQLDDIKDDLKIHIKRSNQNEIMIQALEKKQLEDLSYVKKHIFAVQVIVGLISIVAAIVTIIARVKLF